MHVGRRCHFGHGVNRRAALDAFIASPANVAEGDVILGTVRGEGGPPTAIMAHPPDTTSDLLFAAWVDAAVTHGHAIKIDLKDRRAIAPVLAVLQQRAFDPRRVIANADVILGPGGTQPRISVEDLLPFRSWSAETLLSPGLTTGAGAAAYTGSQIEAIVAACVRLGAPATVPLRAEYALADLDTVRPIIEAGYGVTIWNTPSTFRATPDDVAHFRALFTDALIDLRDAQGQSLPPF